ncbi:MAG: carbonic anhydrase family protein, partial [Bdellovibrionota bacterium]
HKSQNLETIQFDYKSSGLNISNSGYDIRLLYKNGSKIILKKKEYELLNFHFHTPAEHIVHGKKSNIEAHFVHRDKEGNLVVVALMINKGKMNYALHDIFNHIPQQAGSVNFIEDKKINPLDFFPKGGGYYAYTGSLTTPPCSENVKWIIWHDPIEASLDQIMKLTRVYRMNARPTQPLNGRKILQKL